jgi:hypothetical protein
LKERDERIDIRHVEKVRASQQRTIIHNWRERLERRKRCRKRDKKRKRKKI